MLNQISGQFDAIMLFAYQERAKKEGGGDLWSELLMNPLNFMLLVLALLWFMVILPQQRQARDQQRKLAEALKSLKKNDRVVTTGGIYGTIVNIGADTPTVTVRIDDTTNAKMIINREAIARVIVEETKAAT